MACRPDFRFNHTLVTYPAVPLPRFTITTYPAVTLFFFVLTLLRQKFYFHLPCHALIFLRTYPAVPLFKRAGGKKSKIRWITTAQYMPLRELSHESINLV